jgi:hypothetical protein
VDVALRGKSHSQSEGPFLEVNDRQKHQDSRLKQTNLFTVLTAPVTQKPPRVYTQAHRALVGSTSKRSGGIESPVVDTLVDPSN